MSAYGNREDDLSSPRVRVVPGSGYLQPPPPPPPPYAPPKPTRLCKIAVVGDAFCGKSALVQKFLYRRYACDGGTDTNGTASPNANNSIGTSLGTTSYEGLESALAEYHKKDITIWSQHGNNNQIKTNNGGPGDEDETLEQSAVCIRLQLWDMNIHRHFVNRKTESDTNSLTHSIRSGSSFGLLSPRAICDIKPLLPLLKRVNGILIVCRCPLPPSSFSQSSNVSYNSHISNASSSEWPELDTLEQQIQRWNTFLHDTLSHEETHQRSISILLTCADLVVAEYSPQEWIKLSERMQAICEDCNLHSWKIGSCITSKDIINETYSQYQTPTMLQRMMQQQHKLSMDLEDAIEAAFIDMISTYLQGLQE